MGPVHAFKSDGTHIVYWNSDKYEAGEVYKPGTYSFDGTYLVVDGGFKRKVTFTENGNGFEWEQTAILEKYWLLHTQKQVKIVSKMGQKVTVFLIFGGKF